MYGSTGAVGPVKGWPYPTFASSNADSSSLLDEVDSIKSAMDFDFDLVSLKFGTDEIESVAGVDHFVLFIIGFDKCGNRVALIGRSLIAFPGTGGFLTEINVGMLSNATFLGLREVELYDYQIC